MTRATAARRTAPESVPHPPPLVHPQLPTLTPGLGALARFHPLLERGHVVWHLLACFPADHERHQDLADAVTGEVDADGQPGAGVGHWLDQDIDSRPDRPVYAPHTPGPGRVD